MEAHGRAEYVAGSTSWSELNFERFLVRLLKQSLGTNLIFIYGILSLCQKMIFRAGPASFVQLSVFT